MTYSEAIRFLYELRRFALKHPRAGQLSSSTPQRGKTKPLCVVLLVLLAGATSTVWSAFGIEPSYQGKPASYWLERIDSTSVDGMKESIAAFKAMGSNAAPFLVELLQRKPSKLGEIVDKQLSDQSLRHRVPEGLVKALPSADRVEQDREHAAFLISQIGPDAAAAIPALMQLFHDPTEGWRIEAEIRAALFSMGEKLADWSPEFIGYLKSKDLEVRELGANLLETIGPKAKAAVPALQEAVESSNWGLASAAARALWSIGRQTDVALRVFIGGMQSTNSTRRQLSVIYLRQMGSAAKPAGPEIQTLLEDPDDMVRREAEKALLEIDPSLLQSSLHKMNEQTEATLQGLIETMRTGEYKDSYRAVEAVAMFGPAAKPAVTMLMKILNGFEPFLPSARISPSLAAVSMANYRRVAANTLAEIGPGARSAVPSLMALIRVPEDGYGAVYCKALGRIGPDAKPAVSLLENCLTNEDRGIQLAAADALTKIVPQQCSNAVAVLKRLQHDPDLATVWVVDTHGMARRTEQKDFDNPACRFFRLSASVALWRLGLEKDPPVISIVEQLEKQAGSDELAYVELLGEIGREAKPALPLLRSMLNPDRSIGLRRAAAITIRKIDPDEAAKLGLPGTLAIP